MRKKFLFFTLLFYGIYAACMYVYIFHIGTGQIPASLKGSVADPAVFMSKHELLLSEEYSKIRNYLFFVVTPFEWIIYLFILIAGLSRLFEKWAISKAKSTVFRTAIYVFWLNFISYVLLLPIRYYSYHLSMEYGISNQKLFSWLKEGWIDFGVNYIMSAIVMATIYWLMQKSLKNWWLYTWLLSIPFTIFVMFVQPVVIDPLYNDFYPLQNKELETKILTLAEKANIPADHVYEVNMAEKTNAMNAYVTGIGNNSRIVLWDTTLNNLTDREILFIMAHEMGHYVEKHIYYGVAGYILLMLIGLFLTAKIMNWSVRHYGSVLRVKKVSNISSMPLFLLITSFLLFVSSPVSNIVSRYQEERADQYAIALTGDHEAAVSSFQKLTKAGLSEVNPPRLIKWFRYTHPPMLERIYTVYDKSQNSNEGNSK